MEGAALVVHLLPVSPRFSEGETWCQRLNIDTDTVVEDGDLLSEKLFS